MVWVVTNIDPLRVTNSSIAVLGHSKPWKDSGLELEALVVQRGS
jgi:hypothetical protein